MIKRSTWILLGILILAFGAYYLVKKTPVLAGKATPTPTSVPYLVTSADGTLQSIQIKNSQNMSFRMQRNTQNNWVITSPRNGEADQGLASAAESQVGALKILNTLDPQADLTGLNLVDPSSVIDLVFTSGVQHKIEVGGLTPTNSGYYVRFDGSRIYVVSQDGIDSLLNLVSSPPYPATATPAVTDTPFLETPTATP
jgi:hypothetical protein